MSFFDEHFRVELSDLEGWADGCLAASYAPSELMALDAFLSRAQLKEIARANGQRVPRSIGFIYFLFDKNELVYVGQTFNLGSRIKQHRGSKTFDSWAYLRAHDDQMNDLEAAYVGKLKPKYNLVLPAGSGFKRVKDALEHVGETPNNVTKVLKSWNWYGSEMCWFDWAGELYFDTLMYSAYRILETSNTVLPEAVKP